MKQGFRCLLCDKSVTNDRVNQHKQIVHSSKCHYGFMWPQDWLGFRDIYEKAAFSGIYESSFLS